MITSNRRRAVWPIIVVSGVIAAMHVWKLPGALPFLRDEFGLTLVQSGALLGIVQVGAMLLGLSGAFVTEWIGLRVSLITGLALLGIGSFLGSLSGATWQLMTTRGIEGLGFLLVTLVAPPLIRAHARPERVGMAMGWWAAFQGMALFLAVLVSTFLLQVTNAIVWNTWWQIMAALSIIMIPLVIALVPPLEHQQPSGTAGPESAFVSVHRKVMNTLRTPLPWVLAIIFATYTVQWGAIVGFIPDILGPHGAPFVLTGIATAVIGGINGVGNVLAGAILNRGVAPTRLIRIGMIAMVITTVLIFSIPWSNFSGGLWVQIALAALFSGISGFVPSSVTRMSVDAAPANGSVPAVMGLMVQIYNGANFLGPIILTSIASAVGGWQMSWTFTVAAALIGLALVRKIPRAVRD